MWRIAMLGEWGEHGQQPLLELLSPRSVCSLPVPTHLDHGSDAIVEVQAGGGGHLGHGGGDGVLDHGGDDLDLVVGAHLMPMGVMEDEGWNRVGRGV